MNKYFLFLIIGLMIIFLQTGCLSFNNQNTDGFQNMFYNNFSIIIDDAMKEKNIPKDDRERYIDILQKSIEKVILEHMSLQEIDEVNIIFSSSKFQNAVKKLMRNEVLTQEDNQFLLGIQKESTGFQKFTSKKVQQQIIKVIGQTLEQIRVEKINDIQ